MPNKNTRTILSIGFSFLCLVLLASGAYAADFNISTTAEFDAGFKSNSSGNYEIETITDNLQIAINAIELGNKKSDLFTFDDADTETWKWTISTAGGTQDISNNKLNWDVSRSFFDVSWFSDLTTDLAGDFEIIFKTDYTFPPASNTAYNGVRYYVDANNWVFFITGYFSGSRRIRVYSRVGGANQFNDFVTSANSIHLRLRRTGTTLYADYKLGFSWTNLQTRINIFATTGTTQFWASTITTNQNHIGYFSEVNFPVSTFADNTGYRTSGNWTSAAQTMTGNALEDTTIVFSGMDPSHGIVNVTWVVGGVEVAHYDTNITSGTTLTINASDTNVSLNTITSNFQVRLYLQGNGTTSPVIEEIYGDFKTYTAIPAVSFNVSDINISSSIYAEITKQEINTTEQTNFILFSSMNLEKVTGAATNIVWARTIVDGITVHEESLRTISGLNDEGSVMFQPTIFTVAFGRHNVSVELNRSGVGIVEANDIDMILMKSNSTDDGDTIRSNVTAQFYNFSSGAYSEAFNWTLTKTTESRTFIVGKQTINKTAAAGDVASFYFRHIDDEQNSSIWERYLSSATDVGSVLGLMLDILEGNGEQNYTIMSKSSGNMIGANTTIFDMDLQDNNSHQINAFSASNNTSTIASNNTYINGLHELAIANFTIQNGSTLFLTATASFKSGSGAQTPTILINTTNASLGDCSTKKERYLSGSSDIGVVGIFSICTGVTVGNTYQFNLLLEVEDGESVIVIDETLAGFETEPIPIVSIVTPEEEITALLLKIWLLFAISGMTFFIGGLLWCKMFNGKLTLLLIGNLLLLVTAIYSFSIVKTGFGDTTVINTILSYPELGILFWGLCLFNVALLFYFTFEATQGD